MMKLKILNKANQYKLKATASFPSLKKIKLQEKSVSATTSTQTVVADAEFDGLSKVNILPVQPSIDENIKPENIKENVGILGVTGQVVEIKSQEKRVRPELYEQEVKPDLNYNALSKVIVEAVDERFVIPQGTREINQNGEYDVSSFKTANVNVIFTPDLMEKNITENGTYNASDDGVDGYSRINVNVVNDDVISEYFVTSGAVEGTGVKSRIKKFPAITENIGSSFSNYFEACYSLEEIGSLNISGCTNANSAFRSCHNLKRIPQMDTSSVTQMQKTFSGCYNITEMVQLNTQNVTTFFGTFENCKKLISIPKLNASKAKAVQTVFSGCYDLVDFGGFENLGAGYDKSNSANYNSYKLSFINCTRLSEQSMINVMNNVYDILSMGCQRQTIEFGSTNLAKLTSAEAQEAMANAQAKGWNIT